MNTVDLYVELIRKCLNINLLADAVTKKERGWG
jgi:hypothetical protein